MLFAGVNCWGLKPQNSRGIPLKTSFRRYKGVLNFLRGYIEKNMFFSDSIWPCGGTWICFWVFKETLQEEGVFLEEVVCWGYKQKGTVVWGYKKTLKSQMVNMTSRKIHRGLAPAEEKGLLLGLEIYRPGPG